MTNYPDTLETQAMVYPCTGNCDQGLECKCDEVRTAQFEHERFVSGFLVAASIFVALAVIWAVFA